MSSLLYEASLCLHWASIGLSFKRINFVHVLVSVGAIDFNFAVEDLKCLTLLPSVVGILTHVWLCVFSNVKARRHLFLGAVEAPCCSFVSTSHVIFGLTIGEANIEFDGNRSARHFLGIILLLSRTHATSSGKK